ncbi:MAG: DnaJ domain-containing protein [Candidatus Limnocylindrales bacterium]
MTSAVEHDAYEILGVRRGADDATIAEAFRTLARRFHPDIAGDGATRRMMLINAAFDAIRTPERRAEYDRPDAMHERTWARREAEAEQVHRTPPRDGTGGAGRPPGRPSGSVLDFGRHIGWSLGEIARVDPGYLIWLTEKPQGRPYLAEIDALLRQTGYRSDPTPAAGRRSGHGVFQRG